MEQINNAIMRLGNNFIDILMKEYPDMATRDELQNHFQTLTGTSVGLVNSHPNFTKPVDNMTLEFVMQDLDQYIANDTYITARNKTLTLSAKTHKKYRRANFPSEISENIVKFAYHKRYGVLPTWNTSKGDLQVFDDKGHGAPKMLESKAFIGDGPSSFGPSKKWDKIYFVNCKRFRERIFTVYEINLSSESDKWRSLRMRKTDFRTFGDIQDCNERGNLRASFNLVLHPQLKDDVTIIFEGHITDL